MGSQASLIHVGSEEVLLLIEGEPIDRVMGGQSCLIYMGSEVALISKEERLVTLWIFDAHRD